MAKSKRCPLCDYELDDEDVVNNYCPECGSNIEDGSAELK